MATEDAGFGYAVEAAGGLSCLPLEESVVLPFESCFWTCRAERNGEKLGGNTGLPSLERTVRARSVSLAGGNDVLVHSEPAAAGLKLVDSYVPASCCLRHVAEWQ